ncbi:MAG: hypothetical protein WCS87_16525 [Methylococcaceae bacterium]
MNSRLPFLTTLFLATLTSSLPVYAVEGTLTAKVSKTMVTGNATYGGCMALLDKAINTAANAPNCPGNWVSFSCTGTYTSKDMAFHLLDQAQLALALNKQVTVIVNDTKKHNGNCFASRIDVIK